MRYGLGGMGWELWVEGYGLRIMGWRLWVMVMGYGFGVNVGANGNLPLYKKIYNKNEKFHFAPIQENL